MITTKEVFITSNNKQFSTREEAEAYENWSVKQIKQFKLDERILKSFPARHQHDTCREEHCVISGALCNIYEEYGSPHNGDIERGGLVKEVTPNFKIFNRCIEAKIAEFFVTGLTNIIHILKTR